MNRIKLIVITTFLGIFLTAGQALAASEGEVDATKKSTEKGTMQRPTDSTQSTTPDDRAAATDSTQKSTEKGTMQRHMESAGTAMGTQADTHRVSDLMDAKVKGSNGEDLGSVKDIIISSDGKTRYIVLSRGGVLGVGGDLIPVPFSVAKPIKGTEGDFTLNLDQQRIDQAPTVAENELDDASAWEQEVRGYYGD